MKRFYIIYFPANVCVDRYYPDMALPVVSKRRHNGFLVFHKLLLLNKDSHERAIRLGWEREDSKNIETVIARHFCHFAVHSSIPASLYTLRLKFIARNLI
jgi:hypothetical protein